MDDHLPILLNEGQMRFELHVQDKVAFVAFERFDGGIAYEHTVVPEELGGRGIGRQLVQYVLEYAQSNRLKVRPVCPFINAYIDKHPLYQGNSLFHGAQPDPSHQSR
jgi:predicted GNAT family acetyltransferase